MGHHTCYLNEVFFPTLTVSKFMSESMDFDPASLSALFMATLNFVLQKN